MKLTISDKLEIMLREGSFLIGVSGSLIALLTLALLTASDDLLVQLLGLAAFFIVGVFLTYYSIDKHKALWALIADAGPVTGTLEKSRTATKEIDGTTFYRVAYGYLFDGLAYTHCVETNNPTKYGDQELIFIQHSRPANAVLANDLPSAIREKLLVATSS